jgi:hypothetical protein
VQEPNGEEDYRLWLVSSNGRRGEKAGVDSVERIGSRLEKAHYSRTLSFSLLSDRRAEREWRLERLERLERRRDAALRHD